MLEVGESDYCEKDGDSSLEIVPSLEECPVNVDTVSLLQIESLNGINFDTVTISSMCIGVKLSVGSGASIPFVLFFTRIS